jgi:osmotically-inducible protein OsmY
MANERWFDDDERSRRRYGHDDDSDQYSEHWRDRGPRYRSSSYERGSDYDRGLPRFGSRDRDDWTRDPNYAERYYGRSGPDRGYGRDEDWRQRGDERPLWERAKDEVRSWMGDEQAEQRRRADHRGRGPKGYTRSDERIREDVNDRLMEDWGVDATDIEVTVVAGEVTLNGTVDGRESKRRAEDISADVMGVRDVQNNLRVRRPSPTSSSASEIGTGTTSASSSTGLGSTTTTTGTTGTTGTTIPKH